MKARFVPQTREQLHKDFWSAKREGVRRFLAKRAHDQQPRFRSYVARGEHSHNVIGVGVGRKFSDGKGTSSYAVRIYVRQKLPLARLGKYAIPKTIAGVPTDVCETGMFHALADSLAAARKRARPLCAGASVGFVNNGHLVAGTITAIVERDGSRFVLSNNHVLAFENRLPLGANILQPGTLDNGQDPQDRIGTLAQFIPLTPADNTLDAAIALIDDAINANDRFAFRLRLNSTDPIPAKAQMPVAKLGRGSGYTEGLVDDLGVDADVDFDTGTFSFTDQLLVKTLNGSFADLGDSGSLVVSSGAKTQPVAMLFATSPQYALATPIDRVLAALNVSILV